MINKKSKIFIAGHKGHLGSSILRQFKKNKFNNILTISKNKLDLLDQSKVFKFLKTNKPDAVVLAAARVGGIYANNKYRGKFIYENLQIQNNIIHGSFLAGVKNLISFGSSCIYPKGFNKSISENLLLSGKLEYTNEPYAVAKIAGIKMCESYNKEYRTNYKCLMPANSYGPNDNYHVLHSHFFASLIKKITEAKINKKKSITIWGSGNVKRELIYVDDIADACIFFLQKKTKHSLINIGSGKDKTIKEYAKMLMKEYNLNLKIYNDKSKPDGIKRKLLDISLAKKYGWKPKIGLKEGIKLTLENFSNNYK